MLIPGPTTLDGLDFANRSGGGLFEQEGKQEVSCRPTWVRATKRTSYLLLAKRKRG